MAASIMSTGIPPHRSSSGRNLHPVLRDWTFEVLQRYADSLQTVNWQVELAIRKLVCGVKLTTAQERLLSSSICDPEWWETSFPNKIKRKGVPTVWIISEIRAALLGCQYSSEHHSTFVEKIWAGKPRPRPRALLPEDNMLWSKLSKLQIISGNPEKVCLAAVKFFNDIEANPGYFLLKPNPDDGNFDLDAYLRALGTSIHWCAKMQCRYAPPNRKLGELGHAFIDAGLQQLENHCQGEAQDSIKSLVRICFKLLTDTRLASNEWDLISPTIQRWVQDETFTRALQGRHPAYRSSKLSLILHEIRNGTSSVSRPRRQPNIFALNATTNARWARPEPKASSSRAPTIPVSSASQSSSPCSGSHASVTDSTSDETRILARP
ncbi:hypothetical protein P389DRAFT_213001 [Cystobasidium minutum MCA 4210]|uniref:uncharacterized protein n=1 Tax=Cystobasidium minutum MCA 4210 TaxID=1397322 RepID=UPI0034CF6667|eukprot:jgi/Rhomi1/213001/estExt_Genemark1.C_80230